MWIRPLFFGRDVKSCQIIKNSFKPLSSVWLSIPVLQPDTFVTWASLTCFPFCKMRTGGAVMRWHWALQVKTQPKPSTGPHTEQAASLSPQPHSFLNLPTRFSAALWASGDWTVLQQAAQKLNLSPSPRQPCHLYLLFIGDLTFLQHVLLFRERHGYHFACPFERGNAGFLLSLESAFPKWPRSHSRSWDLSWTFFSD